MREGLRGNQAQDTKFLNFQKMELKKININDPLLNQIPFNGVTGILFAGDRLRCCELAIVAIEGEDLLGLATIAPKGEYTGIPTIVGIWVKPSCRGLGIGSSLLRRSIEEMLLQGLKPIRIDSLSLLLKNMVEKLPLELKSSVDLHNFGDIIKMMRE
jgi:GNAT superfamily N-acetyltransferase